MPRTREIIASHLMDMRDPTGRPVKIGAGSTRDGHIVMIYPPEGIPPLNQNDALDLIKCISRAVGDASLRG